MPASIRTAVIPIGGLEKWLPLMGALFEESLPRRPVLEFAIEAASAGDRGGKETLRTYLADWHALACRGGAISLELAFVKREKSLGLGDGLCRGAPAVNGEIQLTDSITIAVSQREYRRLPTVRADRQRNTTPAKKASIA